MKRCRRHTFRPNTNATTISTANKIRMPMMNRYFSARTNLQLKHRHSLQWAQHFDFESLDWSMSICYIFIYLCKASINIWNELRLLRILETVSNLLISSSSIWQMCVSFSLSSDRIFFSFLVDILLSLLFCLLRRTLTLFGCQMIVAAAATAMNVACSRFAIVKLQLIRSIH